MRLSARKVFYEGNSHNTILLTIDDVTRVAPDGTGEEGVDATKGIAAGRGSGPDRHNRSSSCAGPAPRRLREETNVAAEAGPDG